MTQALVLLSMLVAGPWLVRRIAPRLRHYDLTRGGIPPGLVALLMGLCVVYIVYQLLAGLFTGTVICFARNCQGEIYGISSDPWLYWGMVAGLFVASVFSATLASASFLQWQDQRRG
jgi:hypothetical protein